MALALALCSTAHADEREQSWAQSRALDDERLAALRAGVAAPLMPQAGVILWDEPRKSPPPPRNAAADHGACVLLTASVNHR
jgi:hypothetical protein